MRPSMTMPAKWTSPQKSLAMATEEHGSSCEEAVMLVGSQSYTYGASNLVFNRSHLYGKK